jgi:hypothetical protein
MSERYSEVSTARLKAQSRVAVNRSNAASSTNTASGIPGRLLSMSSPMLTPGIVLSRPSSSRRGCSSANDGCRWMYWK